MSKHILIIDHDPISRNHVTSLLSERGFTSDQAASAKEAFSLLDSGEYDLVLLDVALSGHNLFDFVEELKSRFPEAAAHLVLMTEVEPEFMDKLPSDGWCSVLVKPISYSEFRRVVDLCIDGAHVVGGY